MSSITGKRGLGAVGSGFYTANNLNYVSDNPSKIMQLSVADTPYMRIIPESITCFGHWVLQNKDLEVDDNVYTMFREKIISNPQGCNDCKLIVFMGAIGVLDSLYTGDKKLGTYWNNYLGSLNGFQDAMRSQAVASSPKYKS